MDKATEVIREAGQQISDDPLLSLSLQGSLTIFGVDSMSLDGVVITAQFRTVSGAQNTISRAFNARLKKLVDKSADVHFAQHYPQGFLMPVRETEGRAESATVKQQPAVLLTDIPPQSQ